jgi:hypothetical protein
MTDVYILLSWMAFFVSASWSLALATVAFGLFGWASYDMIGWCSNFLKSFPEYSQMSELRRSQAYFGKYFRIGIVYSLIASFTWYGVVWLLALFGEIDSTTEDLLYSFSDVFVKTGLTLSLGVIRFMDTRHALFQALSQLRIHNAGQMSLLRGNFDIVMNCTLGSDGTCWLPNETCADLRKLENDLHMDVRNRPLNSLLTSDEQQTIFSRYVLWTMEQSRDKTCPAVAQILNCNLCCKTEEGVLTKCSAELHLSGTCIGEIWPSVQKRTYASCIVAMSVKAPTMVQINDSSEAIDLAEEDDADQFDSDSVPLLPLPVRNGSNNAESVMSEESAGESLDYTCTIYTEGGSVAQSCAEKRASRPLSDSAGSQHSLTSWAFTNKTGRSSMKGVGASTRTSHEKASDHSGRRFSGHDSHKAHKVAKKMNAEMQTDVLQYADVAVQTHPLTKPPRLPGGQRSPSPSPSSRGRRSRSNSISSNTTTATPGSNVDSTASNVTDFDGIWITSPESRTGTQVELNISNGEILYATEGESLLQQTSMSLDNIWHMLGGPCLLTPDKKTIFRLGKSGNFTVFERAPEPAAETSQGGNEEV